MTPVIRVSWLLVPLAGGLFADGSIAWVAFGMAWFVAGLGIARFVGMSDR